MEFKKAKKSESKLRIAISGASGSGKTYSALMMAKGIGGRIAVIDTERSSASLYSEIVEFDALNLEPPFSPQKYIDAIKLAEREGYGIIIIDSLSHAWSGTGGLLDLHDSIQKSNKGVNGFSAWKEITPIQNRFVDAIISSKCHIISTVRAKQDYVIERGEYKTQVRKVGLAPVQRDGLEYEFTIFFEISQEHVATASKDRTNIFDGKYFTPCEETGRMLVRWLGTGEAEVSEDGKGAEKADEKQISDVEVKKPGVVIAGDFNNTPYSKRLAAKNETAGKDTGSGVNEASDSFSAMNTTTSDTATGTNNAEDKEHTKKASFSIQEIARVVEAELKASFSKNSYTTKQIVEIWERFNGDQKQIMDEVAGKIAA